MPQFYTTEPFWTPMPISLLPLDAIEHNGRKLSAEYDGKLLLEVEYYADAEGNYLSRRNVDAIDGKFYIGQVDIGALSDATRGQIAAEWLMVESNLEYLKAKCEADWQKWHAPKPLPISRKTSLPNYVGLTA